MATNPPTVLDLIAQYKIALARHDAVMIQRIITAYRAMYNRLTPQWQALGDIIASGEYTVSSARRLDALIRLQEALQRELGDFTGYLRTDLQPFALEAAQMGEADAYRLLRFLVGDRELIRVPFDRIPIEAVYKMLTFLDPAGALYARLDLLAGFHTGAVIDAILQAIGMGVNPRQTARLIMQAAENAFGAGLVDALRMARTAQLWAYREASRANYAANSDVVTGWIWSAELDELTCMSCVAMHGTRHDLIEPLDDHYNGRCSAIPEVMGVNPIADMQTGEAWFAKQSEATQRAMMGDAKYDAWKAGRFSFAYLSQQVENEVYGTMRTVTPLKDLIPDA